MVKAGHQTPVWFNEFTAGGGGDYGTPRRSRMWACGGLVRYSQTYLAWTFNSQIGGEEQSPFGLLDHDGRPSWKVGEFARMAAEFKMLLTMCFPRYRQPQVAVEDPCETEWLTNAPPGPSTMKQYVTDNYNDQLKSACRPFFRDNSTPPCSISPTT